MENTEESVKKKRIEKDSIKMKNKTAIQEEVVRVPSRNSRVGTWMEEDTARAAWKVNGAQLPSLQTSVSLQGPLPPVGMGEWGVWGLPLVLRWNCAFKWELQLS